MAGADKTIICICGRFSANEQDVAAGRCSDCRMRDEEAEIARIQAIPEVARRRETFPEGLIDQGTHYAPEDFVMHGREALERAVAGEDWREASDRHVDAVLAAREAPRPAYNVFEAIGQTRGAESAPSRPVGTPPPLAWIATLLQNLRLDIIAGFESIPEAGELTPQLVIDHLTRAYQQMLRTVTAIEDIVVELRK